MTKNKKIIYVVWLTAKWSQEAFKILEKNNDITKWEKKERKKKEEPFLGNSFKLFRKIK